MQDWDWYWYLTVAMCAGLGLVPIGDIWRCVQDWVWYWLLKSECTVHSTAQQLLVASNCGAIIVGYDHGEINRSWTTPP